MKDYNQLEIEKIVKDIPHGLERAILIVLHDHIGRSQAISRIDLLDCLGRLGFHDDDRIVRDRINEMRHNGRPICSAGGEGGGYWYAANWSELNEYLDREVHPRAMDLLEQEKALKSQAEKTWGKYAPNNQISMF